MKRILALSIVVAAGLVLPRTAARADGPAVPNVQIVNLSDQDFAVSWSTDVAASSSIAFGTSCASATTPGAPDTGDGYVHLIDANGSLIPDTTYYYTLSNNGVVDNNGGSCYTVTTDRSFASPPIPNTIDGYVKAGGCDVAAAGALLTVTVTRGSMTSLPLATTTNGDNGGGWNIVIDEATTPGGSLMNPQKDDILNVTAADQTGNTASEQVTYPGAGNAPFRVPKLCLLQPQPNVSPTATATATAVDTATATYTPTTSATAVDTATATSTAIPSGTNTPIAGEVTPAAQPSASNYAVLPSVSTAVPATASPTVVVPTPTIVSLPATAAPSPIPTDATPPTIAPTAVPKKHISAPKIPLADFLAATRIHRGQWEEIAVLTAFRATIHLVVHYLDRSRAYVANGRATDGFWARQWRVNTKRATTAVLQIEVQLGKRKRYCTQKFAVLR